MLRTSREPSISEIQGGPGTHCCPRKGVGRRTLPTALCSAHLLSCSAPDRQGETPENNGWGRQTQSRLGKTDAELAERSWGTRFARHWLRSPGLTRNIFFFLVRETHPLWQSADSLETRKD